MKTKMMLMTMLAASFLTSKSFANADTTIVIPIQNDTSDTTTHVHRDYVPQEDLAQFPGGEDALKNYFSTSIEYPVKAKTQGIQGQVIISFVINENGRPENIQVLQEIGGNCEDEIIRVISNMPSWKPAVQAGHTIRSKKLMGFNFQP